MIFQETKLRGAFVIEPDRLEDKRGFFARTWCRKEFLAHGLNPGLVQCNISFNRSSGTLRGMHYQIAPFEEAKLIRCTRGAIYDVIIDLRPSSLSFTQHFSIVLMAENRHMVFVPEGFAHGFITLSDETDVFYQMGRTFVAGAARGARWNDPRFGIRWPLEPIVVSDRDRGYPDFDEAAFDG